MELISVYPNFANKGGAQNVVLQISKAFSGTNGIVLTNTALTKVVEDYKGSAEYRDFSLQNVYKLYKENPSRVFLSHHRKCTTKLMLIKWLFARRLKIVHVAHSTFNTLKLLSFFPKNIIAISSAVRENLLGYFKVKESKITLIYNGVPDVVNNNHRKTDDVIKVILPGRICSVKRQVEIVRQTKGKINENVQIYFAGVGDDELALKNAIGNSFQYHYLGQIPIFDELQNYDYVCLFSEKEGLGLSLIEGLMFGKPLITNDIPGALDVNVKNVTGFVCESYDMLINCLNSLPSRETPEYDNMSKNARKRYEALFTEEKMIIKYRELLSKL